MCAAMANDGLLLNTPLIGSYNTERLIAFLEQLYAQLVPAGQGEPVRNPQVFVIVCDNVAFHHLQLSQIGLQHITDSWFCTCLHVHPSSTQ